MNIESCAGFRGAIWIGRSAILLMTALSAFAQPAITAISVVQPQVAAAGKSVDVTITGKGFFADTAMASDISLASTPAGSVTMSKPNATSDTSMTATLALSAKASGTVALVLHANNKDSAPFTWDTGITVNQCLESSEADGCQLRWEVDASGVTGSSTQASSANAANLLMKLDWQIARNKDTQTLLAVNLRKAKDVLNKAQAAVDELSPKIAANTATPADKQVQSAALSSLDKAKAGVVKAEAALLADHSELGGATGLANRFGAHLVFKTGYTQVQTAAKILPTSPSGTPATAVSTSTSAGCTGSAATSAGSTTPTSCTAATPQQAFIAEAGGHLGWTFNQNGQGTFAEFGFGARGAFQNLVQSNQVVQSGGTSYVQLSSLNPKNTVGLYEGVARFRLASRNHDAAPDPVTGAYANVSDLLVIEAGYQNNSGLQQLAGNPQTNTRNRFVGRFLAYPVEISGGTHTKMFVGLEFSGGIAGGPKVVQIFWGTNLNPLKLFSPTASK